MGDAQTQKATGKLTRISFQSDGPIPLMAFTKIISAINEALGGKAVCRGDGQRSFICESSEEGER